MLTAKKYLLAAVALVTGVLLSGSGCGFAEVIMRQQWGPRNRLSNTEQLLFIGGVVISLNNDFNDSLFNFQVA